MHNDAEGRKMWKTLFGAWQEAHQNAVEGRTELTKKQIACAGSLGPDPAVEEIEAVEKLERLAATFQVEMDNFVNNRLG